MGRGSIGFYKNRLSEVAQNEKDSKHPDRAFALLPAGRARRGAGRPGPRRAGGRRALGRAHRARDRHRALRQGRDGAPAPGLRDQGHDAAAHSRGGGLRRARARRHGHGLGARGLHGRQPDLAGGGRAALRLGHDKVRGRGLGQRLRRGPRGASLRLRGRLRGADEPARGGARPGEHAVYELHRPL